MATNSTHQRPGVAATLLLLAGVVPFMAGLFGLYALLHVSMPYFGLLFLVYWAAILGQDPQAYLPSVLGGLGGILLGWLLIAMPPLIRPIGTPLSLALLVVVLFCFMRGHARLLVNNATMLLLASATVPELNISRNIVVMVESFAVAAVYMGAVSLVARSIANRRGQKGVALGAS